MDKPIVEESLVNMTELGAETHQRVQNTSEKTEIVIGFEGFVARAALEISLAQRTVDLCSDSDIPAIIVSNESIMKKCVEASNKIIKTRHITEITRENIPYCKKLIESQEVRHLEGIRGFIMMVDSKSVSMVQLGGSEKLANHMVITSAKSSQQQKFFDKLWEKSIPAEQKIEQIQRGWEPERLEVWTGPETVWSNSHAIVSQMKISWDMCVDPAGVATIILFEPLRIEMINANRRGCKMRIVTEIRDTNVQYCKQLAEFTEVRHLEGISGQFGIVDDKMFGATAEYEAGMVPTKYIHCTMQAVVKQQRLFFETLWNKAMPAEHRIRQLEEGIEPERTEVVYGEENAMKVFLSSMGRIRTEAVTIGEANAPQFTMTIEPVKRQFVDLKRRGIRIRAITEVTKDNVEFVKEQMNYMEVRHIDGIKGNFGVSDTEYVASVTVEGSKPLVQTIHSTARAVIEQHHYLFETLWNKAVSAEQRIREIEEGLEPEYLEVINDPVMASKITEEFSRSVKTQAQIMLPLSQSLVRTYQTGIWDHLMEAANRGAQIRLICPLDANNRHVADLIKGTPNIMVLNGEPSGSGFFIVDSSKYLRIEIRNEDSENFQGAIGFVERSNSRSGLKAFKAFFEVLWKQAEEYESLQNYNAMQQEFINTAAHELRTPVQPILGLAQVLRDKVADDEARKLIDIIIRNAKKLAKLEDNVLDLARIESNNLKLNIEEDVNLGKILSDVVQEYATHSKDSTSKLELLLPESQLNVNADTNRLVQVISNLIDNALKFRGDGTITIKLEQDENQDAVVSIRDGGRGIDAEILPRLFTKFATKSSRGTGLGLYISKKIVEAHGGKIWAQNITQGGERGAIFWFSIPAAHRPQSS